MLFIILFAFGIRLISINQSLWLDEATTALVSKMGFRDIFITFLPHDFHPPLYYLLMKYWVLIFGSSEVSLRLPSVIFGTLLVYITYLIAQKLFDRKVAILSAILISTSGLLIYYSQEARMYMLAAFLVAFLIFLLIQKKWGWFSAFLVILGFTDYISLLSLPVFWYIGRKNVKKIVYSHIPLAVSYLFWLPTFVSQLKSGLSQSGSLWWQILGTPTLKNALLIPIKFAVGRITFDNIYIYGFTTLFAVALFGYFLFKSIHSKFILWVWLLLPIFLGILLSFKIPSLTYFRFIFCMAPFYILVANGVYKIDKYINFLIFLVISINLATSFFYLINPKFHREDWRGLVSFVESQKDNNSITIFVADSNMEAYKYYGPNAKIAGPGGVHPGYNQLWLMRYVQDVFDPQDIVRKNVEMLGYKKIKAFDFNGVDVWEYIGNYKTYAYRN